MSYTVTITKTREEETTGGLRWTTIGQRVELVEVRGEPLEGENGVWLTDENGEWRYGPSRQETKVLDEYGYTPSYPTMQTVEVDEPVPAPMSAMSMPGCGSTAIRIVWRRS